MNFGMIDDTMKLYHERSVEERCFLDEILLFIADDIRELQVPLWQEGKPIQ